MAVELKILIYYSVTEMSALQTHHSNSVALVREHTIPTERPPLVGEASANFLWIEGCHMVSAADPHSCNLGFVDRSHYFSFM
jgi:hypothetical protein